MGVGGFEAEDFLLLYCVLVVVHVVVILGSRTMAIMKGTKQPTDFIPSRLVKDETFIGRVSASHANCLENLPLFAVVVLTNRALNGPDLAFLALCYTTARIAQISFHWRGCTNDLVTMRFYCFATSLILLVTMGIKTVVALRSSS